MARVKTDNLYITWEHVLHARDQLRASLKLPGPPPLEPLRIWGVPRGGLVAAVLLSHALDCKLVLTVNPAEATLIVDEFADTGATLREYAACPTAALFMRKGCSLPPDFFGMLIHDRRYIVFPWEIG